MPYPVFYGTLFYPLMSLLTLWINPSVAIRMVMVLVTWLQLSVVSAAFARPNLPRWVSSAIACLVIWGIYPLTNLYNRSAIPEYVATALLTCLVATWFLLIRATDHAERRRHGLSCGLLFTLTAGTHPITALYSLPILVLLLVAAYGEHGRRPAFWAALVKALALPIGLSTIVLAPWVYVLAIFNKHLFINSAGGMPYYYPEAFDCWSTRFFPVPYDPRTIGTPLSKVESAYLDAQISLPILILLLGWLLLFTWRNRAFAVAAVRATAIGLAAFAFFTWLSLYPSSFDLLPSSARMIQIAYRLVTYENLSLLLGVFMLVGFLRRSGDRSLFGGRPIAAGLLIGCLVLSCAGVVIKLRHASKIMHPYGATTFRTLASERRRWISMPGTFYGVNAYTTPGLYRAVTAVEQAGAREARIPVGVGDEFGVPQPLRLDLPTDTWVATNVQPFRWNHLEVDGVALTRNKLRADPRRLFALVPAGAHTLTLRTTPSAIWRVLRAVSFGVLALWLGYVLYRSVRRDDSRSVNAGDGAGESPRSASA